MLDMDVIEEIRHTPAPLNLLKKAPYLREAYKAFLHVANEKWPCLPRPWARNPMGQVCGSYSSACDVM